jgi:hypothetical protein
MNEKKLKLLFEAARREAAPAPDTIAPEDFAAAVMRAIRREPPSQPAEAATAGDFLEALFPRLAAIAVAVILLCVAADWGLTAAGLPGVGDGAAQVTSQYLFNANLEDL